MTTDHETALDILYVITKSNWGGAQKYVFECATNASATRRVGVACGGHGTLVERLSAADIPVFPVDAFQRDVSLDRELAAAWQLFRIFRATRPHVVHLNSSKAGGLGAFIAHLAGVPHVVFTSHGLTFEEDRVWWQRGLIWLLTWLTFMLSDTVICVSAANARVAERMPLMGSRIKLIRIGIPETKLLSRPTARKHLEGVAGIPHPGRGTVWIGTIAELHPNKGLPYLIEGVRELSAIHGNIACVIIGNDGGERQALELRIAESGMGGTIFLAGTVPNAATLLAAFDIFALTSIKEGLPYALLEAGAAGLPVVGSAIPGIQEVVADMTSGIIVQPKRPKEIAGALALLIEDKDRRDEYGRTLRERVKRDFSSERMLRETSALYDSMLY